MKYLRKKGHKDWDINIYAGLPKPKGGDDHKSLKEAQIDAEIWKGSHLKNYPRYLHIQKLEELLNS